MSVQDIETAVTHLTPEEFTAFSRWFEEYAAEHTDSESAETQRQLWATESLRRRDGVLTRVRRAAGARGISSTTAVV